MNTSNDFGELRTPADLLRKLTHDFHRMAVAGSDQYAAFDFFVTANCIVDWLHPDVKDDKASSKQQEKKRSEFRKDNDLPRITDHIASGAKHFVVTHTRHNSITGIEKSRYVEVGYAEDGYFEEPLLIHFTQEEAKRLGVQESIEATELARLVMQFWSERIGGLTNA
jgi:hypothetical protein